MISQFELFPENLIGQAILRLESEVGLKLLGPGIQVSSRDFPLADPEPEFGYKRQPGEEERYHNFFMIYPGKALLLDFRLREDNNLGRGDEQGRLSWGQWWELTLQVTMPWGTPGSYGFENQWDHPERINLSLFVEDWRKVYSCGVSSGWLSEPADEGGDIRSYTQRIELGDTRKLNREKLEFPEAIASITKKLLDYSRVLTHALNGKIPHLNGLLPRPKATRAMPSCQDYWWERFERNVLDELLGYCDKKTCLAEYRRYAHVRKGGSWYDFPTRA